jgi:hypothetical protein
MLAHIQQERPFKIADLKIPEEHSRELKISNALANVAVAEHDIVAVATVRSAEEVKVIACTQSSNDRSSPSQSSSILQRCLGFLITKNPRRDEGRENGDDGRQNCPVVDVKALPAWDGDEAKLRDHVENCR